MTADEKQDMTVTMLTTEALTPALRSAVIEVCIAAHEIEDFKNLFSYIPSGGRHFLTYRGSDLVSHAVATTRWIQPEGTPEMKTAFVDAVSTLPICQGVGYASAAMTALIAGVSDYEIACLQTDIPEFYERLGWQLWRGPLAGRGEQGLIPTPDQRGVMVHLLPDTPPLDLETPLSIEQQPARIWE
jgi:aminoglycoside 2'-N-acetyltransferase I